MSTISGFSFLRHCRGYLSIQRRRRAQVQPAPVVAEQVPANDGEDEAEVEPVANEAQNQNDIQRQQVCEIPTHSQTYSLNLRYFSLLHLHLIRLVTLK